jgi:transcriptional regulator with XRE-family HTH domain
MIGNNIKKLRKHLKLNQTDFGRLIGLTPSAISQIEMSINTPLPKTIRAICIAYETTEEWLKTGKGAMFRQVGSSPLLPASLSDLPSNPLVAETSQGYTTPCRVDDICRELCDICGSLEPSLQKNLLDKAHTMKETQDTIRGKPDFKATIQGSLRGKKAL